jgi:hypothetical protein
MRRLARAALLLAIALVVASCGRDKGLVLWHSYRAQ